MRGNTTDAFGGFTWADAYTATITVAVDWNDHSGLDTSTSTGTLNPMYPMPIYTAFVNPSHLYAHAGNYVVTIYLSDSFGNQATSTVSVSVQQGPQLYYSYGVSGHAPIKL